MKKPNVPVSKAETTTKHLHLRKRLLHRGERRRVKERLRVEQCARDGESEGSAC